MMECKQAPMTFSESNTSLPCFLSSSLPTVITLDLEHQIHSFNQSAQDWAVAVFNKPLLKGKSIYDFSLAEDASRLKEHINNALQGKSTRIETCWLSYNKENKYFFEVNYCPVFDKENNVVGVYQIAVAIEQQKTGVEEIAQREERFRAMVQNSSDIIAVLDVDGNVCYVSPSIERILGYKPEEVLGSNAFDYVFHEERQTATEQFADSLTQPGVVLVSELRLFHKAGHCIDVEVAVNNLLHEVSMQGVVINCRDIIQRKKVESTLRQQCLKEKVLNNFTRTLRRYLDIDTVCEITVKEVSRTLPTTSVEIQQYIVPQQVWLSVAEHRQKTSTPSNIGVEFVDLDNEVSRKLKQLEIVKITDVKDEPTSQLHQPDSDVSLLVPLHFQNRLWGILKLTRAGKASDWQDLEVDLVRAIADQLAIAIQQAQLYQQSSAINADLERQVQERTVELQQKIYELQQLNVLKDDFLSTVSHELRTPLANMKMAIQMLKIAVNSDRRQKYLEILDSECTRETELINDLLDLQRLEVASYSISLEKIKLQDWLPTIIESFVSRTQQHQQILQVDLPSQLPSIESDRMSLGRVLAELLNNACKYTPAGEKICLSVCYDSRSSERTKESIPLMTFTISNQAEIPVEELPHIFEKFYRVPNADPWKQGGTGLGLALVQKLIEKMEGKISVKSGGGWTRFIVDIPTAPSKQLKERGHRRLV